MRLDMDVSKEELEKRKEEWQPKEQNVSGYLKQGDFYAVDRCADYN